MPRRVNWTIRLLVASSNSGRKTQPCSPCPLIQRAAGAGVALKADQRQSAHLGGGERLIFQISKPFAGNEYIPQRQRLQNVHPGFGFQGPGYGGTIKTAAGQPLHGVRSRCVGNVNANAGPELMKKLQVGQQIVFQRHVGGADGDDTLFQSGKPQHVAFAGFDPLASRCDKII